MAHLRERRNRGQHQPNERMSPIKSLGINANPPNPILQSTHNLRTLTFISARNRE
jgi:hypothetical protein